MAMRQILVDHARAQRTLKRGGEWRRLSLEAEALGVTARTVRRDWVKAKGLLYESLTA